MGADVNQEFFDETNRHLLEDEKPSAYFTRMGEDGLFSKEYPFTLLGVLKQTEQNPTHHPEGNVWNHTLRVVDNAALLRDESDNKRVFMWSALLHDIGKPTMTKIRKGRITAYDHDKAGEKLSADFLRAFAQDEDFIDKVSKMVRWHMQVLMVVKNLPYANIRQMVQEVPVREIALLAMCDRLGRGETNAETVQREKKQMEYFLQKCKLYAKL